MLLRDGVSSFCLGLSGWLCSAQAVGTQEEVSPLRPAPAPHPHSCPLGILDAVFPWSWELPRLAPCPVLSSRWDTPIFGGGLQPPTKFLSSQPVGLKRWRVLFIHLCTLRISSGACLVVQGLRIHFQCRVWVQSLVGELRPQMPQGVSALLPQLLSL